MKLFDKLGRLLTKTSLDSEFTTDGQPKIRVSDKPIQKVLEDIYAELRLHRIFLNKRKQAVELIGSDNQPFGVEHQERMLKTVLGESPTIKFADSPILDAFGRLRVSTPVNLWTSEFEYNLHPLYFDEVTATNGTVAHKPAFSGADLSVSTDDGSKAMLQTFEYLRYQPGKSQSIAQTFVLPTQQAGTVMEMGYGDDENGFFLQVRDASTVQFVRRSKASGSVVDHVATQTQWNHDTLDGTGSKQNPSGLKLDVTKGQILRIDLQWLSLGRIRMCFDIHGQLIPAHEFEIANIDTEPSTTTANLPMRWLMENTSAPSSAKTMQAICCSVYSEGGEDEPLGHPFTFGNKGTFRSSIGTTPIPIASFRPAQTFNSITNRIHVELDNIDILADDTMYWQLIYKPDSITGVSWQSPVTHSSVETDIAGTAISGGIVVASGYIAANNKGGIAIKEVRSKLPFTLDSAGTNQSRSLSIVVNTMGGTNKNAAAIANWVEVR